MIGYGKRLLVVGNEERVRPTAVPNNLFLWVLSA